MRVLAILTLLILMLLVPGDAAQAAPKYMIIMIADGWGQSQLDATAYWNGDRAVYESDTAWTKLGMTNYMFCEGGESAPYGGDGFVGIHGYDPEQAWADWYYHQNYATDSGAAATAMSCGEKTYSGSIGMGVGGGWSSRIPLYHVMEEAEALAMATGLVSSVQLSHATPAGFRAHNVHRNNYDEIARELIEESELDLLMGAGHPNYNSNGIWDPGVPGVPGDWKYVGGYETWQDLDAGIAGWPEPWTLIDTKADFEALAAGELVVERVLGCAPVSNTLQQSRAGRPDYNDPEPPYTAPFNSTVPSLATMTGGALQVLGRHPGGFMLMVEGGAVDWAGHSRGLGRLIEELNDFNEAVETVVAWVEANSDWNETCLVVTGDHETGYLWGPDVVPADSTTWFAPVVDNGPGNVPGFYFYSAPDDDWQSPTRSAGHSNMVIPFFARGAGVERFLACADEQDDYLADQRPSNPQLASYLDNTEISQTLFALLAEEDPGEGDGGDDGGDGGDDEDGDPDEVVPVLFALHGNFPNPFNPSTRISFGLPRTTQVRVLIYDLHGRLVRNLLDEVRTHGEHEVVWDGLRDSGQPAPSGVYYCQLAIQGEKAVKKMSLVK